MAQATVEQKHRAMRSRKAKYMARHLPGAGRLRGEVIEREALNRSPGKRRP